MDNEIQLLGEQIMTCDKPDPTFIVYEEAIKKNGNITDKVVTMQIACKNHIIEWLKTDPSEKRADENTKRFEEFCGYGTEESSYMDFRWLSKTVLLRKMNDVCGDSRSITIRSVLFENNGKEGSGFTNNKDCTCNFSIKTDAFTKP